MVLFCLASTLFALVWNGYSFGVQDQKVHLPYLKQMLNPALYP